jgi:hypothetical protein
LGYVPVNKVVDEKGQLEKGLEEEDEKTEVSNVIVYTIIS